MKDIRYSDMILKVIEKTFNKIIFWGIILFIIVAILVFKSNINNSIAYIDIASAILFLFLLIGKVGIKKKVSIIVIMIFIVAVFVFPGYGFTSSTIILLVIGSFLATLLLDRKYGIIFSIISFVIFVILWTLSVLIWYDINPSISTVEWIGQLIPYGFYLIILNILVYIMSEYLVTSIKKSNKKIYELAYFDHLTNLPNRSSFEQMRTDGTITGGHLVLLNIKNMSQINKLYTETIGDHIIIEISKVLGKVFIDSKYIISVTGDEFILCFDNMKDIQNIIDAGIKAFNKQFYFHNMFKQIEFHIACIYCSDKEMKNNNCYDNLHLAVHYAKRVNKVIYYDKELVEIINRENIIEKQLEVAMKKDSFEMYYQGKVDSKRKEIYGVEALARWESEKLGFVSPIVFIALLENMNLAVEFGRLTVNKVFSDYNIIVKKYGKEVVISINASPTLLLSKDFPGWINQVAKTHNVLPSKFVIEVTEDIMIEEISIVNDIFKRLKKFGFKTSLDDFGKGYSSLNYLVELDIDEIKLDRAFISKMSNSEKMISMINHIIQISQEIGIDIVAEGVETEEEVEILRKLGCFNIQGYYYSRPESLRINSNK